MIQEENRRLRHIFSVFLIGSAIASVQGCAISGTDAPVNSQHPEGQSPAASANQVKVTKADFGNNWPLSVNEAVLINDDGSIYIEINGVRYAANGQARGLAQKNGTPDIDSSGHLNQDKQTGLMYVIQRGLTLSGR